ncbi:MAG: hypothetical protein HZA74_05540 [Ignavibacteriales bacterium]|nr:hypothetical protein [Ignavibacteriales bacterium]
MKRINKDYLTKIILLIFYFSFNSLMAQSNEEWIKVVSDENKTLSINKNEITQLSDEIFFWTFEEYKNPTTIDEINEKIRFTKTYFHVNKELSRYRIVDVIYYDDEKNVIKSFHYSSSYEDPIYKYNMPIISGSEMEIVMKKILPLLEKSNN